MPASRKDCRLMLEVPPQLVPSAVIMVQRLSGPTFDGD